MWIESIFSVVIAGVLYRLFKLTHVVECQTRKLDTLVGSEVESETDTEELDDDDEIEERILESEGDKHDFELREVP